MTWMGEPPPLQGDRRLLHTTQQTLRPDLPQPTVSAAAPAASAPPALWNQLPRRPAGGPHGAGAAV
eukprot:CAMPEP_0174363532 /NCGR_PEP_ID=MMETSP0811_2-20130205/69222_1 /TAXON_ID=73025 ORGANISM="Eutreptiella gymnastica-like, Strain CCMP1594" /NCGR_SAMPLE_ID=MMETSP0811_2 /ASSEMBLY_ACC=CAM_ASM_000667 /LENGTH=65 /DNA_ID=CAMNT_0015502319 /DNA_START=21 /DNA_END=215 /DNA_ORIENTATION=+